VTRSGGGRTIVGAFAPELAGVVGVFRERSRKAAHKARLWGLYVRPEFRRLGLGLILVRQAIEFARSLDGVASLDLCVTEKASAATALYQRLGFRVWGVEPAALRVAGGSRRAPHAARDPRVRGRLPRMTAGRSRRVALIRGINVGKAKRVSMSDLKALVGISGIGTCGRF
jgi:hypothetical protein